MHGFPLSLLDAGTSLRDGSLTSVELTTAALARADALDSELAVYLARFDQTALDAAASVDADLVAGRDPGPLAGIPFGVKDILAAADGPTTAQSLILDPAWGAGQDAPVVARLRAAGAVITGKTTTLEFALGFPDPTKPFPFPRNPWDLATWPGGSSSGSGAGVAAGMLLGGLGTDTGGSIRIPAAFCGVSGLMPTFGRVPKSGCVPVGYSLDRIGPLARTAADCATVLAAIAGHDPSDPDCSDRPVPDYLAALDGGVRGLRIGAVRADLPEGADPALAPALDAALATLEGLGPTVEEVTLPYYEEVVTATMVTIVAEALAYHRSNLQARWGDYFAATRTMLAPGALASAADYVQAQRVRRAGQRALGELFTSYDALVTPTVAIGAPRYEQLDEAALNALFGLIFTSYWDGVGNPALAVPMGFTAAGLPLSLQIAGRPFDEATILRLGHAYQTATSWHRRMPPLLDSLPAAHTTSATPPAS